MKRETKVFISLLLIYILSIHGIWWNDNSRLDLTRAIIDENRFEIDSYYNNTGDRSFYNNHYYSDKAPGMSFLGTPVYLIWKHIYQFFFSHHAHLPSNNRLILHQINNGIVVSETNPGIFFQLLTIFSTFFTSVVFTVFTCVLLYKLGEFLIKDKNLRLLLPIIYGIGSLAFQYAIVFYQHATEAFLLFFSFSLLFLQKYNFKKYTSLLLVAGILLGFAFNISYTAVFLILLLTFYGIFIVKETRKILIFIVGCILGASPLLTYNYSIFNTIFDVTQLHMDHSIWVNLKDTSGFDLPNIFIIYRLLFDPYRGLFFYYPIFFFSFIGLYFMSKKFKEESFLILLIFIITLTINSSWWAWEGGTCFGPRHLLSSLPFLVLPISFILNKKDKLLRACFLVLLIISIATNIVGLQTWEWMIGKPFSIEIDEKYKERINSFEVLANPIRDYYFPLFLRNGPRLRIIENLVEGNSNLEVRDGYKETVKYPFLSFLILLFLLFLIWSSELFRKFNKKKFSKKTKKIKLCNEIKVFLSFLLIYVYFLQASSWNENSKMDLTRAIIDENRFEIDSYYNNTGDRSFYNGHYYSDKAPGMSFLGTPVYLIWKHLCNSFDRFCISENVKYIANKINSLDNQLIAITYEPINPGNLYLGTLFFLTLVLSSLPSALTVLLVYKISKLFLKKETQRILITLTYGLGSLAFIYGTVFFTHSLATFLIFLSFYIIFKYGFGNEKFAILSGLLAGLAAVVDYPVALISLLLFFYTLTFNRPKFSLTFLTFLLIGLLPLLLYNFTILGTPFKFVYAYTDPAIRKDVGENMGFRSPPNPFIIYRHLFDPYRGLFFYHPILILSLIGLYYMSKKYKRETLLILFMFLGFLLAFSMRDINFFDFGSSFGARNYLPVIPFLMIPLCFSLTNLNFTVFKILLIISVFNNIIGLQNWEWAIGEANSVYIAEPYRSKVNSFEILYNPIKSHYFPLFLKNGPRARIVENILDGRDIFDIRHFSNVYSNHPFITTLPLIFLLLLIWWREFSIKKIVRMIIKNPEVIFVPAIMILLLI